MNKQKEKIEVIDGKKMTPSQEKEFKKVLDAAKSNEFLGDNAEVDGDDLNRKIIVYGETKDIVGFFTPKTESWKGVRHWRAGALFILPGYRGKGIMHEVLSQFFSTHQPALAWIDDTNTASMSLYKKLGFVRDKERSHDGHVGHWWLKEKTQRSLENMPLYHTW